MIRLSSILAICALLSTSAIGHPLHANHHQIPFSLPHDGLDESQAYIPLGPDEMTFYNLETSGPINNRVNLVFFGDGYTESDRTKFLHDAKALAKDIIKPGASYGPVSKLLNIHAVFVASNETGIGTHGVPKNTPFSLYRPGSELRGVYYSPNGRKRVMDACKYWREKGSDELDNSSRNEAVGGEGSEGEWREVKGVGMVGCDEPIFLGNDPLYGGLGGTPTVITASKVNGPLVLRHELGHTLIPAGEEYDGGYAYFGSNADKVENLQNISWGHWLTDKEGRRRVEDSKVALQAYPWLNLTAEAYETSFTTYSTSHNPYPTSLLRLSISSIPYPSHLSLTIDNIPINFTIPKISLGGRDRAWVQIQLEEGLGSFPGSGVGGEGAGGKKEHKLRVELTEEGRMAKEGQGGKMLTSIEVIEYGPEERFTKQPGYIGAFPTYDIKGHVTLRPTNEGCIMRDVTYPNFCPICLESLYLTLLSRLSLIESISLDCSHPNPSGLARMRVNLLELEGAEWDVKITRLGRGGSDDEDEVEVEVEEREDWVFSKSGEEAWVDMEIVEEGEYLVEVGVKLPEIRKDDQALMARRVVWVGRCGGRGGEDA